MAGASAEQIVAPTSSFVRKPANLGWEEAAGLLLVGSTAVHALTATDVIVNGGPGLWLERADGAPNSLVALGFSADGERVATDRRGLRLAA